MSCTHHTPRVPYQTNSIVQYKAYQPVLNCKTDLTFNLERLGAPYLGGKKCKRYPKNP